MLVRTLVLVAFVAVLGEAIVFGAAGLARMSFQAREHAAIRSAFADGVHQAQSAAIDGTIPAPSATCAYASEAGCVITIRTAIAAATPAPSPTASSCASSACTVYMQNNTHVLESRASYAITASVLAANGDVVMSRTATVAFRTFATAPYASLVGSLDATLDALANGGAGDDGGNAATTNSTLIHVEYQQSGNPAVREPGDVWRALDQHPATTSPSWDH